LDALQAYDLIADLGLRVKTHEDWSFALSPSSRITPELRAAIKEHRPQIACLMAQGLIVHTAAAALELDLENMPPSSPEMRKAYEDGDPDALVEALGEYIQVWKHWEQLQPLLGHPGGSALLADSWGLIAVLPEDDTGGDHE
jgi:hypothetical protein